MSTYQADPGPLLILQKEIRAVNMANGWGQPDEAYGSAAHHDIVKLALITTEVAEGIEAIRHGNPPSDHVPEISGLEEELADVIIRALDTAESRGFNMDAAVALKLAYNRSRGYRHGGKVV